ncbi:metal ABC transporter ATP-binding protein [Paenibacillus sp. FSL R7-0331]|uniref:metal ABC transporter ATP-binding protein n=1 Tax=Paenibacillus sp. FSL R7-0331 TaxID=1536773 RepID=UPI0004F7C511|nr:metal ABC transporter ATP-binding protein [Paenibacillus sp. FSL R7-0331]AIQ51988.1 zinc ABC transporter ATP-binding protein [Paenibacillus sp. FSL R7-0331]
MILSSMRNVVFGYGEEPVIDRLTLDIEAGQFIGITGPNGAAKTTLLKLMLGLLRPWSGTVTLNQEIAAGGRLEIGYVPQQVASFNTGFPSSVHELVRSGCYGRLGLFRRFTKEQEELVERCLRQVEMWDYRSRRIGELSGGQKQRICIARALAQEPQVLVLDEPATGMDAASRAGLYKLMRHYVSVHKRTVIMVTHGQEEAGSYLDSVINLERREREGWTCLVTNSCSVRFGQEE